MNTATNRLRRKISQLFLDKDPRLKVAISDELEEKTADMAPQNPSLVMPIEPVEIPALNPELEVAATRLRSKYSKYRDFISVAGKDVIPLVEHLITVMEKHNLQVPHTWARILEDQSVITTLGSEEDA